MNHSFARLAILASLVFAIFLSPVLSQEKKRTLKEVYDDAVKLYEAQEYASALEGFETFLKHQPNYPYARSYAAKCRQQIRAGGKPAATLETKLASVLIPEVNFDKTELGLVMDFLTQKSEELSGGKVVANFIYKGDESLKKTKTVSLKLRNAPFIDVVRYVGQLTQTRFSYEQFAIVGTPATGSTSTVAPTTNPEGGATTPLESKFDSAERQSFPPANVDPFGKR